MTENYTYAFQPIVSTTSKTPYSYEALIRGKAKESALSVLSQIPLHSQSTFEFASAQKALLLASSLGLKENISLNFTPTSLVHKKSITNLLRYIPSLGLKNEQVIIELTETAFVQSNATLLSSLKLFRHAGIQIAIDDFGAGYSGLNLLVDYQPQLIKLDMNLIRDIQSLGPRQAVVNAILTVCISLGIEVIAEGVETSDEFLWLQGRGIELFQGYLFAKPGFECFPAINFTAFE